MDEAHNLAPSPVGEESDLVACAWDSPRHFSSTRFSSRPRRTTATRAASPAFSKALDPVRFTRKGELTQRDRERIREVNVRRLKREINERIRPPRFCERSPWPPSRLHCEAREQALSEAFHEFRLAVKRAVAGETKQRQRVGAFAVEILGKRLLSCPWTFAESWHRYKLGARCRCRSDRCQRAGRGTGRARRHGR